MAELSDRLLAEVGIEPFYSSLLGELKPQGTWLMACCPFHDDHDPSLAIHREKGFWKCYTGCGEGDMVAIFARMKDLPLSGHDFKQTAQAIEKEFFNGHKPRPSPQTREPAKKEKPPTNPKILEECRDRVMALLDPLPPVEGYPPEYGVRLSEKGTPREAFAIPVYHCGTGLVVNVKFRLLTPIPREGKDPLKSLNMGSWCRECQKDAGSFCYGKHRASVLDFPSGLMGYEALKANQNAVAVWCEGEKDMLATARRISLARYVPVSLTTGASALIPEGGMTLFKPRRNLLCYDADRAGRSGMTRLSQGFGVAGIPCGRVDLVEAPGGLIKGQPDSKDLFDYFHAGGTAEALMEWFDKVRYESGPPPEVPGAPPSGGGGDDGKFGGGKGDRPEIEDTVLVHEVVRKMEKILVEKDVELYSRMGSLCRIIREERSEEEQRLRNPEWAPVRAKGSPVIQPIPLPALRMLVSQEMKFQRYDSKKGYCVDIRPPADPCQMLLSMGDWRFRTLDGFATAPFLRPDGTVCETPGYDAATGMIYEPDQSFDAVPKKPTRDDAVAALVMVSKPFLNFPFEEDKHLAATMAAMLTMVARPAIKGPCPMFTVTAPTPGSGKTLLVWMAVSAVTGEKPASTDWVRDDDEFRKTVISMGLAGDRAVLLDNVEGQVGSALLSNILTSERFRGRLLGVNEMVNTELKMVWFATGNNLVTRADGYRRVVSIHLDAKMEFPTKRHFRGEHADPMGYVKRLRTSIIPALLTVLRAYHLAGHPKPTDHVPTGSFESWDDWVRCSVLWAMGVDCRRGLDEAAADSEVDRTAIGGVLDEWHVAFPSEAPQTIRGVVSLSKAPEFQTLHDALCSLNGKGEDRPIPKVIAGYLRRYKNSIINGLRLERSDDARGGIAKWLVRRVEP